MNSLKLDDSKFDIGWLYTSSTRGVVRKLSMMQWKKYVYLRAYMCASINAEEVGIYNNSTDEVVKQYELSWICVYKPCNFYTV